MTNTETETDADILGGPTELSEISTDTARLRFQLDVTGIDNLEDALEMACLTIGRHGVNALHILATTDDGEEYLLYQGTVVPFSGDDPEDAELPVAP